MSILQRWKHRGYFVRKYETKCHYVEIEWTKCVLNAYYDGPVANPPFINGKIILSSLELQGNRHFLMGTSQSITQNSKPCIYIGRSSSSSSSVQYTVVTMTAARKLISKNITEQVPKKVQFSQDEQVRLIVDTFTQEDKPALWYTRTDLKEIRGQSSCSCIPVDDENTKEAARKRMVERRRQREFVVSLLSQQHEHKLMGVEDPKGLFQFSRACSKLSRKRALQVGRDQEKEIKLFEERRQETLSVVDDAFELLAEGF
jgi:hypothetical protein